jgi:fluoride exporter
VSRFLWICLGGALGTGARYLLSGWLLRAVGPAFPVGTLAVNVVGSFLLGFLMQVATTTELLGPTLRLTLTTGVMGGFTTYSTFNYETLRYFEDGAVGMGALNIAATLGGCLFAGLLGLAAGRAFAGA